MYRTYLGFKQPIMSVVQRKTEYFHRNLRFGHLQKNETAVSDVIISRTFCNEWEQPYEYYLDCIYF